MEHTKTRTKTDETSTNSTPSTTRENKSSRDTYRKPSERFGKRKTENNEEDESQTTNSQSQCPECESEQVHKDAKHGELVCDDCGLVIDDAAIDHGPDWRAYNATERDNKSRVGSPESNLIHDKGLSTQISWENRDANGQSLSASQRTTMKRLREWDERTRAKDSQERNLKQALGEINRMSSELNLPKNVAETASMIYRQALEKDMIRGRSIEAMTSAAIHGACRQAEIPRTLDQVAAVSRIEKKDISSAYRYCSGELGLQIQPTDPSSFLSRVSSDVGATNQIRREAKEMLTLLTDRGMQSGKNPAGLAASALYAADQKLNPDDTTLTQQSLAESVTVCEVTIRNRSTELLELDDEENTEEEPETEVVIANAENGQYHAMVESVNTMIQDYDLLTELDDVPWSPPYCSNALIVNADETDQHEYGTWHELCTGHHINTKYATRDKKRRLKQLADECDATIEFSEFPVKVTTSNDEMSETYSQVAKAVEDMLDNFGLTADEATDVTVNGSQFISDDETKMCDTEVNNCYMNTSFTTTQFEDALGDLAEMCNADLQIK